MIDIRDSDGYVAAGTHGNGLYTSTLSRPVATTGPGGVTDDLSLWLKADAGITESSNDVSAWADQSTSSYDFSDAGTSAYQYDADGLNYNPEIINSDGTNRRLENTTSITLQTVVLVTDPDNPDVLDNPFSEVGADDEGIRADASTSSNWDVPGAAADFTASSGQGWLNGTLGSDPAHDNGPNILVVEAPSSTTLSGGIELGDTESNRYWHGSIAEVIGYSATLSSSEREQVQTYLAIKYGIHLGTNYVASDATTLWDATTNSTYHNDIAGIGRDDDSDLDQKQSTSQSGAIVEIGLGTLASDNASNANSFSADGSFMIWGHDNASSSIATSFSGSNVFTRMARIWTVEETGTVGTVEVQIPDSYGATYLIVSSNSSLTSPTEYALTDNGDGTRSTTVNFSDGQFFTFGSGASPGGVASSLSLWLKADAGVTESSGDVTTWADQSGSGRDASDSGTPNLPSVSSTDVNYNPVIEFDSANNEGLQTSSVFGTDTHDNFNIFVISKTNTRSNSYAFNEDDPVEGRVSGHFPWNSSNSIIWAAGSAGGDYGLTTGWTESNGILYIWGLEYEASSTRQAIYRDGTSIASDASISSFTYSNNNDFEIASSGSGNYYDADIAEIIVYTGSISDAEQDQIETYLGIKYGVSLSHDYVATDGTTLWNATTNSTYHNDVAGIGRDDSSELNQKQSDTDILTVALGSLAADNASNSNTFSTDQSFLILGHDNGGLTESSVTISSQSAQLIGRTWLAEETNEAGTLEIQADFSGLTITGTEARDFYLILDTNTDPTDGYRDLIRAASFASDIATFSTVDIEDGDYVMLLTSYVAGTTDPPLTSGQSADGVLGQSNFTSGSADNGGVSASTVDGPSYIAIGPTGKLFASDTDNNRVLRWSSVAAANNGGAAEAVLGQSSFSASSANRGGSVAANTLYEPHGLFVSSTGALYVADSRNNRVLRFDNAESASSGASADAVLGQADFTSNDANQGGTAAANSLRWPTDLAVDGSGNLWVADWLNHRVLRYDNVAAKADGANADGVLGQESLTTSLRMWKDGNTDADSFVFPAGVCVDDDGILWVADSGNSRILRFDAAASKANGADADGVLGQPDFTSWRTTRGNGTPAANTLQWPEAGLDVDQNGRLWVADRWGDRVLWFHNAASKANGADADGVIGQGSFTSRDGSTNSATFNSAHDVIVDESNDYVWVVDHNNNRILRFDGSDLALGKTNTLALAEMPDLWLQADKNAYANDVVTQPARQGDPVHVWLDQSRRQFTALADSPPLFVENAVNGHPAVQFGPREARMRIEGGIFGQTTFEHAHVWAVLSEATGLAEPGAFSLVIKDQRSTKRNDLETIQGAPLSHENNLLLGETALTTGTVAELIATYKTPSLHESSKIATYLAIKYGVSFRGHYLSSVGDTLWDPAEREGFSSGIAGIGRDDVFGLMQTASTASEKHAVVAFSLPAAPHDTQPHVLPFQEDRTFALWGHDGEELALNQPTSQPEAAYRMQRTWYLQKQGAIDSLLLSIPAETRAEYLLVDPSGTFTTPTVVPLSFVNSTTLTAYLDVDQATYFTFASSTPYDGYGSPPAEFVLHQNYPNPFNPTTTIRFDLPEESHAYMDLYDILGRRVRVLIDEEKPAGTHSFMLDATGLASGVYFYRMKVGNEIKTQKMLLAK